VLSYRMYSHSSLYKQWQCFDKVRKLFSPHLRQTLWMNFQRLSCTKIKFNVCTQKWLQFYSFHFYDKYAIQLCNGIFIILHTILSSLPCFRLYSKTNGFFDWLKQLQHLTNQLLCLWHTFTLPNGVNSVTHFI